MPETGIFNVNEYPSIAHAAADIPREGDPAGRPAGGILYFPPGLHLVPRRVEIPSRTVVCGAGTASYVKRSGKDKTVFRCRSVHDVVFSNLAIDVNWQRTGPNFLTAIDFDSPDDGESSRNCVVDNVFFTTGERPNPGETHHAVLCNNAQYVRISRCRVINMQFKCAAPGPKAGPVTVIGNHFTDPYNYAISFVAKRHIDNLQNLTVAYNVIENLPSKGGIYVGTDGERSPGVGHLAKVHIVGNQIVGNWNTWPLNDTESTGTHAGIFVRLATSTEDLLILDNVVRNTNQEQGKLVPILGSYSIIVRDHKDSPVCDLRRCMIRGNVVENADHAGIRVFAGFIEGLRVADNQLYQTRGIELEGSGSDWIVSGNYCHGKMRGILLKVRSKQITRGVEISGNICKNHYGGDALSGIELEARRDAMVQANIRGNKCYDDQTRKTQHYGLKVVGDRRLDVRECDNDFRDNAVGETLGEVHRCFIAQPSEWVYVINDGTGTPRIERASDPATSVRQVQPGEYVITFKPELDALTCVATLNNSIGAITAIPGDHSGLLPNQVRVLTLTQDNDLSGAYDFTLTVSSQP